MSTRRSGRAKSIFDPVHGPVVLTDTARELVGDPAFQRLWGIRQTGLAHLVFPGANHTRLEHSLGVFWVARQIAERLALDEEETELVGLGGLLHDLGHAPLSHTLDGPMRETLGLDHEGRTERILRGEDSGSSRGEGHGLASRIPAILERAGIDPREVAALVGPREAPVRRRTLRALLHGAIDADRIDYLQRDAHYTGVAHGAIDAVRVLDTIGLAHGRLAFAEKGRSAVEGFLVGRSLMYASVYFHKTVRAAEVMAQAAVERLPGYPDAARALLSETDGDLFARLDAAGGRPQELADGLRARRLYKRVYARRALEAGEARNLRRLARRPADRRAREDEISSALGGAPGTALLDLSGLVETEAPGADWSTVGIVEGTRVSYPFRGPGLWGEIARRPRNPWPVSLYVHPRYARAAPRRLRRELASWA